MEILENGTKVRIYDVDGKVTEGTI